MISPELIQLLSFCDLTYSTTENNETTDQNQIIAFLHHLIKVVSLALDTTDGSPSDFVRENDYVLQLERIFSSLRQLTHSLLLKIEDERKSALQIIEKERFHRVGSDTSVTLLLAIYSEYNIKIQSLEVMAPMLLSHLDTFYYNLTTNVKNELVVFRTILRCFESNIFSQGSIQRRLISLLERQSEGVLSPDLDHISNDYCPYETKVDSVRTLNSSAQVVAHNNVLDAHRAFKSCESSLIKSATFLLLVGPEGSGKTYICDTIEKETRKSSTLVIRPNISTILRSKSVGEAEAIFASTITDIKSYKYNVLVILEDIHELIGHPVANMDESTAESHLILRCLASLFSMMDTLRVSGDSGGNTLVLATCRTYIGSWSLRFDRIYYLGPPDEFSRKLLISSFFITDDLNNEEKRNHNAEILLHHLVSLTEGFSYAALASTARRSVENVMRSEDFSLIPPQESNYLSMLEMKESLKLGSPESLQPTSSHHFADLRISTSKELLSSREGMKISDPFMFSMKGESALKAWDELQKAIVIPFCHSKQLLKLIGGSAKSLVGGVLLVGDPGCGKSEIALQCATYCCTILPSLKLFRISCTSLIHKEVGASEKAIQMLFETVRQASPCMLILDRIENIAAPRGDDSTSEGTMDRVLSTLLMELDGIEDSFTNEKPSIAVIGITQYSDWVDAALQRPGRLGNIIKLERDFEA